MNTESTETEPKKMIARNTETGLFDGVEYPVDVFGFIDWRKMIPKQFLFPNKFWFESRGKEVPTDITGLEDHQLLIKLAGIKYIARIRGYERVEFELLTSNPYPVVKCLITWQNNVENPLGCTFEEIASCNPTNSDELSVKYMESIATNRAFVRCVRNFLNINIVGEEEIAKNSEVAIEESLADSDSQSLKITPQSIFLKSAKEKKISFDDIVKFVSERCEDFKDKKVVSETDILENLSTKSSKKLLKDIKNV